MTRTPSDLKSEMRADLEQTIEIRVERYLEVEHQGVIPNHHFAAASSECINLYRDGYLLSAVMVSQSASAEWAQVEATEMGAGGSDDASVSRPSHARAADRDTCGAVLDGA